MRIFLNDDAHDVERGTLAARSNRWAWRPQDRDGGERPLRAAAARPATTLTDGDRVEVVAPMQGG
jgi:hypothetical protein